VESVHVCPMLTQSHHRLLDIYLYDVVENILYLVHGFVGILALLPAQHLGRHPHRYTVIGQVRHHQASSANLTPMAYRDGP